MKLLCSPILLVGFILLLNALSLRRRGLKVDGVVVDSYVNPRDREQTSYPIVEFTDPHGIPHRRG